MKSVLLYVFLVGLPVLGVVGILRLGGTFSAPPNLRGSWRGGLSPAAELVPPCVELSSEAEVFDIAQSGVHVSVTLNDAARTHLDANMLGSRLWGRADRLPLVGTARSACPDAPLEFAADLVHEGDVPQLLGNLWAGGCAACAPVSFRAERVSGGR